MSKSMDCTDDEGETLVLLLELRFDAELFSISQNVNPAMKGNSQHRNTSTFDAARCRISERLIEIKY